MFIDTHCHIEKEKITQPSLYMRRAQEVGVGHCIVSFCNPTDLVMVDSFFEENSCFFGSIGFHPEFASQIEKEDYQRLEQILLSNNKVVAIGEIGLDYYWNKENKDSQKSVFRYQMNLAKKLNLPVVIHSRDAISDTYEILSEYPEVKGVIHCFSGSLEMALKFIELGYYLGIGGVLTFKNSNLGKVVEQVPLSCLVLETDSPYLSPEPVRGTVNESKNIPYIAEKLAEIKNLSIEEVGKITTENAIQLFDLVV